jgi:hypothetical protein
MKIHRIVGRLLLLIGGGCFGVLSVAGAESPDVRARVVAPAHLAPGATATVVVEMALGSNWHVNSHTPSEKFLIPTEVKLTTSAGTLSAVRYPPQVEKRFPFSEKPLAVYEGTVRFEADLSLPRDASGTVSLAGTLSYQACNDKQCFPPAKVPLEASIAVSKAER